MTEPKTKAVVLQLTGEKLALMLIAVQYAEQSHKELTSKTEGDAQRDALRRAKGYEELYDDFVKFRKLFEPELEDE